MSRERRAAVFGPAGAEVERDIDPEIGVVESKFWDTTIPDRKGLSARPNNSRYPCNGARTK
jgi:hypothetical protein